MILYVCLLFVLLLLSHISGHFLGHRPRIFTHRMVTEAGGIKGVEEGSRPAWTNGGTDPLATELYDSVGLQRSIDAEDFHDLVAEVVDDFDGDAAGGWFFEWAGGVAVE